MVRLALICTVHIALCLLIFIYFSFVKGFQTNIKSNSWFLFANGKNSAIGLPLMLQVLTVVNNYASEDGLCTEADI